MSRPNDNPIYERRKEPRVQRLLGVSFIHEGEQARGTVVNVSATGAFIHSKVLPPVGARLEIALKAHKSQSPIILVVCEVVRVVETPQKPSEVRGFGVKWISMRSASGPLVVREMLEFLGGTPPPDPLPLTPTPTAQEYSFVLKKFVQRDVTDPRFRVIEYFDPTPKPSASTGASHPDEGFATRILCEIYHRGAVGDGLIIKLSKTFCRVETVMELPPSSMVTLRIKPNQGIPDLHILGLVIQSLPQGVCDVRISSIEGGGGLEAFKSLLNQLSTTKFKKPR